MKKTMMILPMLAIAVLACKKKEKLAEDSLNADARAATQRTASGGTFKVFDQIPFYDGYAATVTTPTPPTGVTRVNNSLYAVKISSTQLATIGSNLKIKVTTKAACDNYDRIGRVYLSLVPKGTSFDQNTAQHLEIGRFITPFMDKNKTPNEVSYTFDVANLADILKDTQINQSYDIWAQLSVFGVPYAAQKEISGCAGNNLTCYGTLEFSSTASTTTLAQATQVTTLSYMKLDGDGNNNELNSTNKTATGAEKTIAVNLPKAVNGAKLYLITSNHGANSGGEEYVRRVHKVYFDNTLKLTYTPGGKSCEPYRQYNTQSNGIYGPSPKSTSSWTSWNNWCPGDAVPIRIISLGNLAAGAHTFKIVVEGAKFANNQGYIPIGAYLQGTN